jgi:hypothetical protein
MIKSNQYLHLPYVSFTIFVQLCKPLERELEVAIEKTFNSICMHAAAGYLAARPLTLEITVWCRARHRKKPEADR